MYTFSEAEGSGHAGHSSSTAHLRTDGSWWILQCGTGHNLSQQPSLMHPSNFCIDNNLENVGVLISTVFYVQLYKCCLTFTWTFCLWHSKLVPISCNAGHASLSLLYHKSWLEILFSLKVALKRTNSGEKFQIRELISWRIPSKFFTKALIKATALCLPVQRLLLTQNTAMGWRRAAVRAGAARH